MRADWSLTNHQRLSSCLQPRLTRGAHWTRSGPAAALRPRVPVLVPSTGGAMQPGFRDLVTTQQTGLFQLQREAEAWCWWVIRALRPRHEDRQRQPPWHLETSGAICHRGTFQKWRMKGGYCQTFQQCRCQSINLLNQSRDRSSVKSCLHLEQRASIQTPTPHVTPVISPAVMSSVTR